MNNSNTTRPRANKHRLPILARHAVSLALVFAIALPVSYFVGQRIYGVLTLGNLFDEDQARFEQGLSYVYNHAADRPWVAKHARQNVTALPTDRGARLLIALSLSDAESDSPSGIPIHLFETLAEQMPADQAIGLYDKLAAIPDADIDALNRALLESIPLPRDRSVLATVNLLEPRMLWSKEQVPTEKWLNWLAVLARSDAELTQHKAARLLGDLPDQADNPLVLEGLEQLAQSRHDSVRAQALAGAAGYARIAKDPVGYEQVIFLLGQDTNKVIARRAWMVVGHLNPFSGFAVNWKEADPFVAEAMLWAAVKTNPGNPKPAIDALKTNGYEAAGALAVNEWRRPPIPVSDADLIFQKLIDEASEQEMLPAWRSILASKDYMNAEATVIYDYGYKPIENESLAVLYFAGHWVSAGFVQDFDPDARFAGVLLTASLEGIFENPGSNPAAARRMLVTDKDWPPFARLLAAAHGIEQIDLDRLVSEIHLDEPILLDLFTLALTHAENDVIDRFIRSSHPEMVTMAALASAMKGYMPRLIEGFNITFLKQHPDLDIETIRAMNDDQLAELGLSRVDALTALLGAAEAAPPSAGRAGEAKLLRLALWMRGDLSEDFTPRAEAMLFDDDLPTSTVLMALLHKQRPIALEYLFGDLVQPRPDLGELFIQQRFWHVFRRFVDTSDLTLWLWGDPEAQAFQLEAMRQWYAVNRWRIERGWWPEVMDD